MARHELLNNIRHKDLRIKEGYSADYGDSLNSVWTFPGEFIDVQREYPILFRKHPETGEFRTVALLGFETGENLFLRDNQWCARYIPAIIYRGPFLIGFQKQLTGDVEQLSPVIHVDMDDPRVNEQEGQRVFLEYGGNTDYIQRITASLLTIHEGLASNKNLCTLLSELKLLEPVRLDIEFSPMDKYVLAGYYTIHAEKVANLDAPALLALHQAGFLQAVYCVISSLGNMQTLVEMKRTRILRDQ